jgi:hypothetical protein
MGLLGVVAGLLALAGTTAADEPKPQPNAQPPWQRLLRDDDAKQADKLQAQINERAATGAFADAIQTAKELLRLRERLQGGDRWEVASARLQVKTLERRAALSAAQQADYRGAAA